MLHVAFPSALLFEAFDQNSVINFRRLTSPSRVRLDPLNDSLLVGHHSHVGKGTGGETLFDSLFLRMENSRSFKDFFSSI